MQQDNGSHWNHKWSALALAVLLTLFLAFGRYRGEWGTRTAAPAASPAAAQVKVKKTAHAKPAAASEVAGPVAPARGERLREKGEALGGGTEEQEETDAEKAGK